MERIPLSALSPEGVSKAVASGTVRHCWAVIEDKEGKTPEQTAVRPVLRCHVSFLAESWGRPVKIIPLQLGNFLLDTSSPSSSVKTSFVDGWLKRLKLFEDPVVTLPKFPQMVLGFGSETSGVCVTVESKECVEVMLAPDQDPSDDIIGVIGCDVMRQSMLSFLPSSGKMSWQPNVMFGTTGEPESSAERNSGQELSKNGTALELVRQVEGLRPVTYYACWAEQRAYIVLPHQMLAGSSARP